MQYRSYNNGNNYFGLGLIVFLMLGGFKTLFLLLPLLSFFPLFIFFYVGYKILKAITSNSRINNNIKHDSGQRLHYVELMIHLTVHAIKADGKIDPREIQAVLTFFNARLGFQSTKLLWVQDLVHHSLRKHVSLDVLINEMNSQFKADEKQLCMELLLAIMLADDEFSIQESNLLDKIAAKLNIDSQFYEQLKNKYSAKGAKSDYDVLGISENSAVADIKKAYKQLCKKYHPDKVHHLGGEFKQFAEEKIKEINVAYDNIMKKANA
jgi:DnaJ like chaperone protein